jgi:formylglycine-generating enzyme required for sulfatase activity
MTTIVDRDLRDEMLKLVRYKILFVRREYEVAFDEQEDLVEDNMDATAFAAWKVAEFVQSLARGKTFVPTKWLSKKYPDEKDAHGNVLRNRDILLGLPEEDKKYLRVYYEILDRYPREKFKHEEQQIRVLEQIRDELKRGANGSSGGGQPTPGSPAPPRVPKVVLPGKGDPLDPRGALVGKVHASDSAGDYFVLEATLPPGVGLPLHRNTYEDQTLYVVDGTIEVQLGDSVAEASSGSVITFPRGTPHRLHNIGPKNAVGILTVIPARLGEFIEKTDGMSDPEKTVELASHFGVELLGPPYLLNTLRMPLVAVPAGEFQMGSPPGEPGRDENNVDEYQHRVRITKPFFMGMHAVTVGQFRRFITETGYVTEGEKSGQGSIGLNLQEGRPRPDPAYNWQSPPGGGTPNWLVDDPKRPSGFKQTEKHPVVCVSWNDAQEFCTWLSKREKDLGRVYRLPTEAEWEYACRAQTTTAFCNGDSDDGMQEIGNCADAALHSVWIGPDGTPQPPWAKPWNDGHALTAPVGAYRSNAWHLYDMHGNVGEWCQDWYDPDFYKTSPVDDPKRPEADPPEIDVSDRIPGLKRTLRVIRGGVWLDAAKECRSADRRTHRRHPVDSAADIGFRIVMETAP